MPLLYSSFLGAAGGAAAAGDPHFADVVLLSHFTGANGSTSFTDESNSGHTLTANGDAQIQSNKLELDGAGDFVSAADSADWTFGGDFTLEAFGVEFQSAASNEPILTHYNSVGDERSWLLQYNGGQLKLFVSSDGSGLSTVLAFTWTPSVDTPYDICVDRSGNDFRLYIDGTMVASATSSIAFFNSSEVFAIGRQNGGTPAYGDIRLTAARITKGTARYADDGGYTVPSLPLPAT